MHMFNAFNIVFPKFIQCSHLFGMIISYFEQGSIFTIINRLVFEVFNPGGIVCFIICKNDEHTNPGSVEIQNVPDNNRPLLKYIANSELLPFSRSTMALR